MTILDTWIAYLGLGTAAFEDVGDLPGGSGAPDDADYLVGTTNGSLSGEIVVGTTPGGELGGTWGSPTVDATHSGSTHAAVQAAAESTAAGALAAHEADTTSIHGITDTSALVTTSTVAELAQDAVGAMIADTATIDLTYTDATPELKADVKAASIGTSHLSFDVATQAELDAHTGDSSAAHAASAISADSTTLVGVGTDVQAVLEELDNGIADHLADSTAAHAASAISFSAVGTIASTDAQTAIAEVASDAATALSTHEADTTSIHGIANTANLETTSGAQAKADAKVDDTAYDATAWNGVTTIAPTKNAVRDKVELLAPLASPAFSSTPTAPTAAQGTNTTQLATTAYVQTEAGLLVPKSLVDAKGDLVTATADNTPAVLTVGANDTILMADSGAATGLKWVAAATPSTQAIGDSAAEGTADTFTRGDHKHAMPAFATNAVVLGTAAAAGSAATLIRSDATIAAFDATSPTTQAFSDAAAVGVVAFAARRDHKHAMPALGTGATNACAGNDSRLSDARTPSAHATTHRVAGSDPLFTRKRAAGTSASGTPGTSVASVSADASSELIFWTVTATQANAATTQLTVTITYSDATTTTLATAAATAGRIDGNSGGLELSAAGVHTGQTVNSAKAVTGIAVTTLGAGTGVRAAVIGAVQIAL